MGMAKRFKCASTISTDYVRCLSPIQMVHFKGTVSLFIEWNTVDQMVQHSIRKKNGQTTKNVDSIAKKRQIEPNSYKPVKYVACTWQKSSSKTCRNIPSVKDKKQHWNSSIRPNRTRHFHINGVAKLRLLRSISFQFSAG